MVRRTIALVGGLLALILLVIAFRGCLNARQERSIENYVTDATELVRQSNLESRTLFNDLLQGQGGPDQVVDIQNALNGLSVESSGLVDRARDLDVPDEMAEAQNYLIEVLELRRDGLRQTANAVRNALGDAERRQGTQDVAGNMQVFLASDVLYAGRFRPNVIAALDQADVNAQPPPESRFIPDIEWLQPEFVAAAVNGIRTGTGTGGGDGEAAPGLHGNGIVAVTLGGIALTPGGSATVQLADELAFEVQVQNQGENTETDVIVRIRVGEGNDAIELEEPIDTIAAGETQTVTIPLAEQPPTGQNVPIEVEVEPVPGEEMTDNNVQDFSVIFTS